MHAADKTGKVFFFNFFSVKGQILIHIVQEIFTENYDYGTIYKFKNKRNVFSISFYGE